MSAPDERQLGPDGDEYALQGRLLALDPVLQQEFFEIQAFRWRDGELIAEEARRLTANRTSGESS